MLSFQDNEINHQFSVTTLDEKIRPGAELQTSQYH